MQLHKAELINDPGIYYINHRLSDENLLSAQCVRPTQYGECSGGLLVFDDTAIFPSIRQLCVADDESVHCAIHLWFESLPLWGIVDLVTILEPGGCLIWFGDLAFEGCGLLLRDFKVGQGLEKFDWKFYEIKQIAFMESSNFHCMSTLYTNMLLHNLITVSVPLNAVLLEDI